MCCRAWIVPLGLLALLTLSACSSKVEAPAPAPGETGAVLTEADQKKLDELKARFNQMREKAMAASADKEAGTSDAAAEQASTPEAGQAATESAPDATAEAPVAEPPTGPRPSLLLGAFLQPLNAVLQNSLQAAMNAASQAVPAAAPETPAAEAPATDAPATEAPGTGESTGDAPQN